MRSLPRGKRQHVRDWLSLRRLWREKRGRKIQILDTHGVESSGDFGRDVALVRRADVFTRNCADAASAAIEDERLQCRTKCRHIAKTAAPGDAVTGRTSVLPN